MKLIRERYRWFITSECKRCGYVGMTEAGPYRDQPDAEGKIVELIEGWIEEGAYCVKCSRLGLEFSINVLREKDRRRLWVLTVVLLLLLGALAERVQG